MAPANEAGPYRKLTVSDHAPADRKGPVSCPHRRTTWTEVPPVEIDELQHFTSHRALTLSLYPTDALITFDRQQYLALCEQWSGKADRAFAHKPAVGFGPRGRPRQRAYNDSLRDLLTPMMDRPPVIRIPVPDRDVVRAYAAVRDLLNATWDHLA